MLVIGLTGSIATGKSTVSRVLSQSPYSIPVIDADVIAREVVEPGTRAYRAIVNHFGPSTPDLLKTSPPPPSSSGLTKSMNNPPLDRAALGRRVFGHGTEHERKVLNRIVHPPVRRTMAWRVLRAYLEGHWAVVLDVPLLFESRLDVFCGVTVVVGVRDEEVQLRRLLDRDRTQGGSLSESEARGRIASQRPIAEKVQRTEARGKGWGEVVWNDGSREDLAKEIERAILELKAGSPAWWAMVLLLLPPLACLVATWSFLWGSWVRRRFSHN